MEKHTSPSNSHKKFVRAANLFFQNYLNLKKNETFLILSDESSWELARKLWQLAVEQFPQTFVMAFSRGRTGANPLIRFLVQADVALLVAREFRFAWADFCSARNSDARWAGLTGIRPEQFARLIDLDLESLVHNTEKLRDVLKLGKVLTIQVDAEHSLSFEIDPKSCFADTGLIRNPGDTSCLPGGRVLLRPLPKTPTGDLLINGSAAEVGLLKMPARFLIRDGHLNKIYSKENLDAFRSALRRSHANRRTLVRVGIGVNPRSKLAGNPVLDQRARGVVHLAFGNEEDYNLNLLNPALPVVTFRKASLQIDNKWIMKRGKFLI